MPELPDLQAFSSNLQRKLKGKKVKSVHAPVSKKLNVPLSTLKKELQGQAISKVYREGKELHFDFQNGNVLALHLMLRGELHLSPEKQKHEIFSLGFENDTNLTLSDFRKMATVTLNPEPSEVPDALSREANASYFKKQLAGKRTSIKNFLMDQHLVRGIGNAYADEILWDARISPFSTCSAIPPEIITKLVRSIKKILKNAEKKILQLQPDIISGELRDFLQIHHPDRDKSPTGATILTKTTGGRKTYYTNEQKLYK